MYINAVRLVLGGIIIGVVVIIGIIVIIGIVSW